MSSDTVRLSDLAGRHVYLDVFGSWCLPSREKYPEMIEVAEELSEVGALVVGLILEDTPEAAAAFFAENGGRGYPFPRPRRPDREGVGNNRRADGRCFGCGYGAHDIETLPVRVRAGLTERHRSSR